MITTLTIVRYPRFFGWAGFLSMAFCRIPLWFNQSIAFWKLMGCGKNGSFDKTPDWQQWALLIVHKNSLSPQKNIPWVMTTWWYLFNCEKWNLTMEPLEGHGLWDGKAAFGILPKQTEYEGSIGILTRATIRISKLSRFWQHVHGVASQMATAPGFVTSVGIGEIPWLKQATFSIWTSKALMKQFAYQLKEHAEVVKKTHQENWYSEDMFVRFKIIESTGKLQGKLPFEIKP